MNEVSDEAKWWLLSSVVTKIHEAKAVFATTTILYLFCILLY